MLGDSGQNMNSEPVRFRKIGGNEVNAALKNIGNEGHAASEAIEFGNDKRGTMKAAEGESFRKFRPISVASAFYFDLFSDQRVGSLS